MQTQIVFDRVKARLVADDSVKKYIYDKYTVVDEIKQRGYAIKGLPYLAVKKFVHSPTLCTFKPGLVSRIADDLRAIGETVELVDRTQWPGYSKSPNELHLGFELWPEQRKLIEAFKEKGRGIWYAATNSGKTECAGVLIHETCLPTLFLVNRRQLLYQTKKRFEKMLGESVGIIGDSACELERVVIATVQTIKMAISGQHRLSEKIKAYLRKVDLLILDECHNSSAQTWLDCINYVNAPYVLGMSGTAWSGNPIKDLTLEAHIGPVIGTITNKEQVEKGRSAQLEVFLLPVDEPVIPGIKGTAVRDRLVYKNKFRNECIVRACCAAAEAGLPCIVSTESKSVHVKALVKLLKKAKLNWEVVEGNTPIYLRDAWLASLAAGKLDVILATTVLDEGVNVPAVAFFIDAGATETSRRILQQVGRTIRQKENNHAYFLLPIDGTHPTLLRKSSAKLDALIGEDCFTFTVLSTDGISSSGLFSARTS